MSDINWLNDKLADELKFYNFEGLQVILDEVLTQSAEWRLYNSQATWLVGCWPPQRFVVSDGEFNFRSGRILVRVGSWNLIVSSYNLKAKFKKFKFDMECHGGGWYLGGVGQDSAGAPVTRDRIEVSGELHVECENKLSGACLALEVFKDHISAALVARLPGFVEHWVRQIDQYWLGPGCPGLLHNTITVMPYKSKECCEGSYRLDDWGCLVGGQFNGEHHALRTAVRDVQCKPSATEPGKYVARCETLPGTYAEQSPGVCREADHFPHEEVCLDCGDWWPAWRRGLGQLAWADTFLSLFLVWGLLVCCCFRFSSAETLLPGSPSRRRASGAIV